MASTSAFHLAFTVRDISETRAFFGGLLGCTEGFVLLLEPRVRGKGAHDPSGNTFEFKGLRDPTPAQLLARR